MHKLTILSLTVLIATIQACAPSAPPSAELADEPSGVESRKKFDDEGVQEKIEKAFARSRESMVRMLRSYYNIKDERVLEAMSKVPRHAFVPEHIRELAYADSPLPIGEGQTISQPFIVAYMTECLALKPDDRVLEIGTGSGYQAAILAEIVEEVYTIEIIESLAKRAEKTLRELGYDKVAVKVGDGYRGWKEQAPFDAIIVTCAPDHVPQPLLEQLAVGGRMIVPVGKGEQELILLTKKEDGIITERKIPVLFVPMTGEAQEKGSR